MLHIYNVHHKVHVDFDLKWHGQEPTEMFEIYEKLGEGYIIFYMHIYFSSTIIYELMLVNMFLLL